MKTKWIFFIALLLTIGVAAQNTELTLTMRDGDIITGKALMKDVVLNTRFGKLTVPIKNITEIQVGIIPDTKKQAQYENLVKQMASGDEEMAQKAYEQLIQLPVNAIPVIEEMFFSEEITALNFTGTYNLESVLSALKALHNIKDYSTEDIISIDYKYTIGGVYDFKNISLKTAYGTLTIPKQKIARIEVFYYNPNDKSNNFKLMASKHISSNADGGWLYTGIMVKAGQNITVHASGTITLASLSNNQYTPDGKINTSTAYDDEYTENGNYPTYGNVVFKIGENGEIQKAGSRYSGTATQTGMLYLSIYETVYNPSNKGVYTVRVAVK